MRLTNISVNNFRSIKNIERMDVDPLQALVGENNSGKSNLLRTVQCFLSAGAGGTRESDFNNPEEPVAITCEFGRLSGEERRRLRQYLLGDKVILRKELRIFIDESRGRSSVKAEYHGYQAEPRDEYLSIKKLEAPGGRVNWKQKAEQGGILDYVQDANGRVNKTSYVAGLTRYFNEHDVEYDEPVLGQNPSVRDSTEPSFCFAGVFLATRNYRLFGRSEPKIYNLSFPSTDGRPFRPNHKGRPKIWGARSRPSTCSLVVKPS